ncbi:hypothetical protein Tco_1238603 [Tanacetum coccineum]
MLIISTPSDSPILTTFFSNNIVQNFQKNSDDEADERSSEEYLIDLELEFHERALLVNAKRFIKRKNNFSSQKANEDTECYKCGKKSSQSEPKFQKDYKAEYKKMKAKLSLLEDEEEVSNDEEMTYVKVLIGLADDELAVGIIILVMVNGSTSP